MAPLLSFDQLTDGERRYLALYAYYRSEQENDIRYWHADPVERARLRERWRQIADALHTNIWEPVDAPTPP